MMWKLACFSIENNDDNNNLNKNILFFFFKKQNKNPFKNIQFKLCEKDSLNVETKERCVLFMVAVDVIGSST